MRNTRVSRSGRPAYFARFTTGRPGSPYCDRPALLDRVWRSWGGQERMCVPHGFRDIPFLFSDEPPISVAALADHWWTDVAGSGNLEQIGFSLVGDEVGRCGCLQGCAWSGPLAAMWVEDGLLACPACHEAAHGDRSVGPAAPHAHPNQRFLARVAAACGARRAMR